MFGAVLKPALLKSTFPHEHPHEHPHLLHRRWFAADTQEERKVWMDRLNQALMDLHTWTPLAPAQDAAHNRSTQSCGSNRDSAL